MNTWLSPRQGQKDSLIHWEASPCTVSGHGGTLKRSLHNCHSSYSALSWPKLISPIGLWPWILLVSKPDYRHQKWNIAPYLSSWELANYIKTLLLSDPLVISHCLPNIPSKDSAYSCLPFFYPRKEKLLFKFDFPVLSDLTVIAFSLLNSAFPSLAIILLNKSLLTKPWLFFLTYIFFPFIFTSWRLITLQYCSGFCHTLTWISHGFLCGRRRGWDVQREHHWSLDFFFDISIAMNIQLSKYISNSLTALHIHSHCPSPNLVHYWLFPGERKF